MKHVFLETYGCQMNVADSEVMAGVLERAGLTLVDRPAPSPKTIELLQNEFLAGGEEIWAVVPEFNQKHGHPIVIGREMIEAFLRAPATSNAREVEHANQTRIRYVTVSDPNVTVNVNTPDDFQKLHAGLYI